MGCNRLHPFGIDFILWCVGIWRANLTPYSSGQAYQS